MSSISFRMDFEPKHGEIVQVAKNIQRLTCPNSGPFTFHGTNTYLIGEKHVAVLDPGPEIGEVSEAHYRSLILALKGRTLSHIVVTHTHVDHSPLARRLAQETGAKIYAEGPHRASRELHLGETNMLDASGDKDFMPDIVLAHGDKITGSDFELEAIFTPGHTANHMAFALKDSKYLFSGDHVMAWATSIVAPPDGNMSDYMRSLATLLQRDETSYLPGHGGQLDRAKEFVRGLRAHRKMRETAVLHRIKEGDHTIPDIVSVIYKETDTRLHGAAGLSVFAHIEDLILKKKIRCEGAPALNSTYFAA